MSDQEFVPFYPKRALLSVSDKRGLVKLAKTLHEKGVELVATGNTAAMLQEHHLPVTEVSTCTKFPEMLNGRVKTLHPAIHAGLLARGRDDEMTLHEYGIQRFDLLIINLYPFEQTISDPDCDFQKAIENIDIGGPAMIRAAAKNHTHVLVIITPDDYEKVETYLHAQKIPQHWGFLLAKKAFAHTAAYDAAIANYLGTLNEVKEPSGFPAVLTCQFEKQYDLRYGENPHQQAIFYRDKNPSQGSLATAKTLQGKPLSYNNLLDVDAAFNCIRAFSPNAATCVIVKHGNPCGVAIGDTTAHAYLRAHQADPISSYGGILAFNRTIDAETARAILAKQFAEVIIGPAISEEAKAIFATKPAMRVLITGEWSRQSQSKLDMRTINGGLLVQEHDDYLIDDNNLTLVSEKKPSQQEIQDLMFAWITAKYVKSNAIVLAKNAATIGIGPGQTSRIMSTRIALWQAKEAGFTTTGAVLASDAFIPFSDNIEMAAEAGITAIIQPGGSIRDKQVIAAANAAGIAMIFTGCRHFNH
ncbi:Bifunctional purine biosynthesis protein PurH [Legionella clemsonensis]|uniref:Bifunctional purine biosynthesis protein PurH n=2 Tax=Legionella clemsonensis TaxID=1867846 RepID=A0A222P577_9GAMM|nr:bifunctional phosphoribosylaminoimidazolecarboxamide formyltransferase/IMP cyclohydrolase [Legionella clemsonensis]ASQ46967.1 Bifunctional purine biosynthesis protein PurH [Legionella clemsonensis]